MMLTDWRPTVKDTDEYIREYVRQRGKDNLPVVSIYLAGAISEYQPDMAIIYYDQPGCPVLRVKQESIG